jgi:hypothetical protein
MTEQSSGQGLPDVWGGGAYMPGEQGGYVPGERYHGPGAGGAGRAAAGTAGPGMPTTPIWQAEHPPGQPRQAEPPRYEPQFGSPQGAPLEAEVQPGARRQPADAKGFLGALFDFSFTSFVTTRIIKVLYVLILIMTSIAALVYTIIAFRLSPGFGFLTLVIGDPLFIIIVMALWRLVLESFVVRFRIAEDVRALRERDRR